MLRNMAVNLSREPIRSPISKIRAPLELDFVNQEYFVGGRKQLYSDIISFSRPSPVTVWNRQGQLITVPAGEPAYQYDPATGEALGQLIQTNATNLAVPSGTDKDTSYGSQIAVPASLSKIYSKAFLSTGNAAYPISRVSDFSTPQSYVWSAFCFAVDPGAIVGFRISSNMLNNATDYRLSLNGTLAQYGGGPAPNDYGVKALGGGVYLIWVSVTTELSAGSGTWYINQGDLSKTFAITGLQVEVGTKPTSHIPTDTGPLIRSADTFSFPVGPWFNPNYGTLIWNSGPGQYLLTASGPATVPYHVSLGFVGPTNVFDGEIAFDSGSGNNKDLRLIVRDNQSTQTTQFVTLTPDFTAGGVAAFRYSDNEQDGSIGGQLKPLPANVDMSGTMPALTQGYVNSLVNASIKSLKYFPYRVDDATFEELTA